MEKPNGKSEKLDPLPDHNDSYWPKDADNKTFEAKQVSCVDGHNFKPTKKANEVKCGCGVGYVLATGMELRPDGHIYFHQEFVI